jgi:flagellar M-ring protein FliF
LGRLAALAGGAFGLVAVLAAIMLRMGAEPKALLYADLDLKEAAEITTALDAAGVKYEIKGDGSTLMVDRDQVASTRLLLSGQGLPSTGSVGYEIFDETSALGQTDFQQTLNRQRALEGELARTLRSLDGVSTVRVHLTMPKRDLFEAAAEKPTAAVVVGLKRGELPADKVLAIRNLVSGAVPGLSPGRVTVVDDTGKTPPPTAPDEGDVPLPPAARACRAEGKAQAPPQGPGHRRGRVGAGRARGEPHDELDLNRVTPSSAPTIPTGRSSAPPDAEENSEEQEPTQRRHTRPGQHHRGAGGGPTPARHRQERRRPGDHQNYVILTTRTVVQEPGRIPPLYRGRGRGGINAPSATTGAAGQYQPRAPEEMQRIEQLVRSAVGFDASAATRSASSTSSSTATPGSPAAPRPPTR